MKTYVVLFVAFVMLVKPLWPIAEYIVNYDYIVNVLCENKDKPQLECNGKCYLAKQLAKENGKNDKNPFGENRSKTEMQQVVYFRSLLYFDFGTDFNLTERENFKSVQLLITTLLTSDISPPPKLA